MPNLIESIAILISKTINWSQKKRNKYEINRYPNISKLADIGEKCALSGPIQNIVVGDYTYINNANMSWGNNSKLIIGSSCAIGYNVSIKAKTHSKEKPTNNENGLIVHLEKSIIIGNNVWVGDNVFIREGVVIGDNCIIGANSVVTKSFVENSIIAGVPAKSLKKN